MAARAKQTGVEVAEVTNFSGGPNFRDSPTELAATESYDAFNCTFDERGGVASRLGYQKRNPTPLASASFVAQMLAASPSLYWRFGEGVGATTAADTSGNGHTGSYGTGATLGINGALLPYDPNTAVALDGSINAYVVATSYQPFVAGSSRTFMGWAYRTSQAAIDSLFGTVSVGVNEVGLTIAQGGGDVTWCNGSLSGANTVTWAAAWPALNTWVHWALTYNDTTRVAELFINGVSKGHLTVANTYGANRLIYVGKSGSTQGSPTGWHGDKDEFAVFESIVSGSTVTAIYNSVTTSTDLIVNDYYSALLGNTLTQSGRNLFKADNTTPVHTFSTKDCVTFAELAGNVIAAHPVDGIWYSTNGTAWTKVVDADAPTAPLCCVVWQSKLFVGLSDGSVHWSALGDPLTWSATDFNEIWEKDQSPIVALHVGSGQDIQGRPGLVVFKQDSCYRINSAATGAYTVLDTSVGAAGPKAVTGVGSRVCWIGKHGIFWWREDQAGPVNASDLLRPAWRAEQLSYANQAGWAAGRRLDRAYFSCSSLNSSVNDVAFEFHPDDGWITPRSDAMTCYSTSRGSNEATYGGSPTAPGQVYQLDTSGTDDGQNITGWFQTRWLTPNSGFQAQVWQVRLHGRGSGTMTFRIDYESAGGSTYTFDLNSDAGASFYDNGVLYDSGAVYATVALAGSEALAGLGSCRQFSLRFDFVVDTTTFGRQVITSAPAPAIGQFGLYGLEILFIPLGTS